MFRDLVNQVRFGYFAGLLRYELTRNGSVSRWLVVFECLVDIILTWQDIDAASLRWAFARDLEKFTKALCKDYDMTEVGGFRSEKSEFEEVSDV